ncbi:MAG: lipopolysaccharide biosynthesis protein [Propionibacteriaceae bacterium]|nr:lipopolysaccharide biosynthesis protein [Propionibacteriaceae bacterium]
MTVSAAIFGSRHVARDGVIWNSAASLIFALQSYVLVWVASITLGTDQAGIMSLATAQAYLFWTIGGYSMRRFQVSDVARRFSFVEYIWSRAGTVAAMVIVCAVFLVVDRHSGNLTVVALVTLLRVVDVCEDVVYGELQQQGHLHAAGRVSAVRSAVVMVVYGVLLFVTHDLVVSLVVSICVSAAVLTLAVTLVRPALSLGGDRACRPREVGKLLAQCFPLFAAGLLAMYLANAPKYAIEAALADPNRMQGLFAYLVMPVFIINVVSGFIYNPMVATMAHHWRDRALGALGRLVGRVAGTIVGLTIVATVVGYFIGPPVLSFVFHERLDQYAWQFAVLMIGGGMSALAGFATSVLTVQRQQVWVFVFSAAVSLACLICATPMVAHWSLNGACVLSTLIATAQAVMFTIVVAVSFARARGRGTDRYSPVKPQPRKAEPCAQ